MNMEENALKRHLSMMDQAQNILVISAETLDTLRATGRRPNGTLWKALGWIVPVVIKQLLTSSTGRNMINYGQKKTLLCIVCDKFFKTEAYYIKHIRNHHYQTKMPKCDVCGTSFASKSTLTKHITLHDPHLAPLDLQRTQT